MYRKISLEIYRMYRKQSEPNIVYYRALYYRLYSLSLGRILYTIYSIA